MVLAGRGRRLRQRLLLLREMRDRAVIFAEAGLRVASVQLAQPMVCAVGQQQYTSPSVLQ